MELMRRRRGIMGLNGGAGIPIITATATGNPLTFETDLAIPLKSLVIPFTPIQAAGTPSPDNPLPISGWTGANISRSGKNLFNKNDPNMIQGRYFTRNGTTYANVNYAISYVPVNPGDKLVYSGLKGGNGNPCGIQFFDTNKTFLAMGNPDVQQNNATVTAPSGAAYIGISVFYSNNATYKDIDTAQLEIGSVATDYEPYQATTLPINWQSEAGTIYGGTVTLNEDGSVDVVVDKAGYDMGSLNWITYNTTYTTSLFAIVFSDMPIIMGQQFDGWIYCSCFKPMYGTSLGYISTTIQNNQIMGRNTYRELYIKDTRFTSAADFKAAVAGQTIVVSLENPITYHFNNIGQLITFAGTNSIWTDTNGTNTATYLKHQS